MEIKATGLFQLKEAHGSQLGKIVYGRDPPTLVSSGISKDAIEPAAVFSSLSP